MEKVIAKKTFMTLYVRLIMLLVVLTFIFIGKTGSLFNIVSYLMIIYGTFILVLAIHQIFQHRVLISSLDNNLIIYGLFSTSILEKKMISTIVCKQQSNRGYAHSYGKVVITTTTGKKITVLNVYNIVQVEKDLNMFIQRTQ